MENYKKDNILKGYLTKIPLSNMKRNEYIVEGAHVLYQPFPNRKAIKGRIESVSEGKITTGTRVKISFEDNTHLQFLMGSIDKFENILFVIGVVRKGTYYPITDDFFYGMFKDIMLGKEI
jgi:hypothetical protein